MSQRPDDMDTNSLGSSCDQSDAITMTTSVATAVSQEIEHLRQERDQLAAQLTHVQALIRSAGLAQKLQQVHQLTGTITEDTSRACDSMRRICCSCPMANGTIDSIEAAPRRARLISSHAGMLSTWGSGITTGSTGTPRVAQHALPQNGRPGQANSVEGGSAGLHTPLDTWGSGISEATPGSCNVMQLAARYSTDGDKKFNGIAAVGRLPSRLGAASTSGIGYGVGAAQHMLEGWGSGIPMTPTSMQVTDVFDNCHEGCSFAATANVSKADQPNAQQLAHGLSVPVTCTAFLEAQLAVYQQLQQLVTQTQQQQVQLVAVLDIMQQLQAMATTAPV